MLAKKPQALQTRSNSYLQKQQPSQTSNPTFLSNLVPNSGHQTSRRMDDNLLANRLTTVQISTGVHDEIDMGDINDPQCVAEYMRDIQRYYREVEGRKVPPANYMSQQCDINEKMRAILVDWLVEVHNKFKLMPETLYLTIHLIDRFLAEKTIARTKLQLVGVAAMFIASKYEEIYAPEVRDFVYISDKAYTREEILKMEGLMLNALRFQLSFPTVYVFVKRYGKVAGIDQGKNTKAEAIVNMLVELSLQEYKMLKYLPSTIAASAVYLALKLTNQVPWNAALQHHTRYTEASLKSCIQDLSASHNNMPSNSLGAVRKKYSNDKHEAVAKIPPLQSV